ncbi:hypothetical protein DL766_003024 [Monosporascus sp. MC13-8B]|uniref:NmrA-like domain-containing protein n=1 Tax=Monosporascus cannonballus TaxID=155416 RepID=A0ABY0H828_9PEZI|nr:hypothetical protein DL762_004723 [Monosporascus cannonballus]RYO98774.1 hypothetical protein DL763_002035 [Monosporascus cannonballus]RYP34375.1 hypothetical protein DL766_003024 [Monosporascus sp. MC13-8B]
MSESLTSRSHQAVRDNPDLVLPKGSPIPITGATGSIASNVIFEALEAGYEVEHFVYTSSSVAATLSKPNETFKVDRNLWNTEGRRIRHAERTAPNFNIGRIVSKDSWASTMIIDMYEGKTDLTVATLPQHMINDIDNARLHLTAAVDGML